MTSRGPASPAPAAPDPPRWVGARGRKILHAGAWSMVAKAAAAANLFISVPFVLEALGPAQFGAWATLVSLVVFAGFLDFGFGNGTMNLVAAAQGRGATDEVRNIIHESRRAMVRIAMWLAAGVLVSVPLVPWHRLLGMPEAMASPSRAAAAVVLCAIVLAVPLNLAYRVQLGLARGDRAFRWQAIGQLLALSMVVVLAKAQASLSVLTAAAVVTPLLASLVNSVQLWRDPGVAATSQTTRDYGIATRIRREGLLFFALQLTAALSFSADLPLISALRGPTEAGTYAIVQRLFSIIPIGLSLVWAPLWPIYRQALAAGDHAWVRRTLHWSIWLAAVSAVVVAAILAFWFDIFADLWVKRPIPVSTFLLAGFALWCAVDAIGTALGAFLNAAGILRYQLILAPLFVAISLALKVYFLNNADISVLPWITTFSYVIFVLAPLATRITAIRNQIFQTKY